MAYILGGGCCNLDLTLWDPGLGGLERKHEHQGHYAETWLLILALLRMNCVPLGKSFNLSGPQFLLRNGNFIVLILHFPPGIKWDNIFESVLQIIKCYATIILWRKRSFSIWCGEKGRNA